MAHLLGGAHGPNWHVDLALTGLAISILVIALVRGRGLPRYGPDAATALAVFTLFVSGRAFAAVLLVVPVLQLTGWAPNRYGRPARLVLVALLPFGLRGLPVTAMVVLAVGLLVLVLTADRTEAQLPRGSHGLLVVAAAAALWAGAPDTEKVVLLAAAVKPIAWLELLLRRRDEERATLLPAAPWLLTAAVLLWAGADGFHGRPGGIVLLPIVTAMLCGPAVLGLVQRPRPTGRWSLGLGLVGIVGSGVVTVVAARTVGLAKHANWPVGAALVAVVLAGWWAVGLAGRRAAVDVHRPGGEPLAFPDGQGGREAHGR